MGRMKDLLHDLEANDVDIDEFFNEIEAEEELDDDLKEYIIVTLVDGEKKKVAVDELTGLDELPFGVLY